MAAWATRNAARARRVIMWWSSSVSVRVDRLHRAARPTGPTGSDDAGRRSQERASGPVAIDRPARDWRSARLGRQRSGAWGVLDATSRPAECPPAKDEDGAVAEHRGDHRHERPDPEDLEDDEPDDGGEVRALAGRLRRRPPEDPV